MTTDTSEESPRLTDQDRVALLDLIRGSDSVELKLTVPVSAQRATIAGLPLDPVEAQPRQVFFFDTPELALSNAGVVVRARRIQGGRGDTVVKLRPVVPSELPSELRRSAGFNVEVDVLPGGFVCSASLKGRSTGAEVHAAVTGELPLHRLFSREQRAYFADHAPAGLTLDALVPLGPTYVLKDFFQAPELGRRLVAEMWLYPDGSRILEISTRCDPREAFQVGAEARAYLTRRGVPISAHQQTKTRLALDFFAAELRANAGEVGKEG